MSIAQPAVNRPELNSTDLGLYAVTVFAWGFSWIAMKGQVSGTPPEVSVFWRFVLSAAMMMVFVRARGYRLAFPLRDHLRFAGLGVLLFSTNFTLFYYGAGDLPSGLLAVVFSTASVFNIFLGMILFGQRPNGQTLAAGLLGFSGIALMFWPNMAGTELDMNVVAGLGFCIAGTLSFCLGNMLSADTQRRGIGVMPATAWGMVYGMVFLGVFTALRSQSFQVEWTLPYLGSLIYLALVSSVIAFASYLTLLGRIGSARAGYATVLFPIVALAVSTIFEGYQWTPLALGGLACVIGGNIMMMRTR